MDPRPRVIPRFLPARLAGRLLSAAIACVLVVRRPRPIHSGGEVLVGELLRMRTGPSPRGHRSGIRWIDEPPADGRETVTARLSRGIGFPEPMPDVLGLAVRVDTADGPADIALSTTGRGFPSRFALAARRSPARAWFGSLMPYRGTGGPVLLAARPRGAANANTGEWTLDVFYAGTRTKWHPFAQLRLRATGTDTDELRFDPVNNVPAGAATYEWSRLLRSPAYARARRSNAER